MKSKRAVALRYEQAREEAPRIVAKGAGEVAKAILKAAGEHTVPIMENSALVNALMDLEIDSVIPTELYQAVAEVLAYVYQFGQNGISSQAGPGR